MVMENKSVLLTDEEGVEYFRGAVTTRTLANWRSRAVGPSYIKVGSTPLYKIEDLEEYLEENKKVIAS